MTMMPRFVTFFTPEYASEAKQLADTARDHNLQMYAQLRHSRGSWQSNCTMKPTFLREALDWSDSIDGTGIVWVDADARFVGPPILFSTIEPASDISFAAFRIPNVFKKRGLEHLLPWDASLGFDALASGTVYLANDDTAREFLEEWEQQCEDHPARWDQQSMQAAWGKLQPPSSWLPQSYCKVFDCKWFHDDHGVEVIRHTQASRKLKRKVKRATR